MHLCRKGASGKFLTELKPQVLQRSQATSSGPQVADIREIAAKKSIGLCLLEGQKNSNSQGSQACTAGDALTEDYQALQRDLSLQSSDRPGGVKNKSSNVKI